MLKHYGYSNPFWDGMCVAIGLVNIIEGRYILGLFILMLAACMVAITVCTATPVIEVDPVDHSTL